MPENFVSAYNEMPEEDTEEEVSSAEQDSKKKKKKGGYKKKNVGEKSSKYYRLKAAPQPVNKDEENPKGMENLKHQVDFAEKTSNPKNVKN